MSVEREIRRDMMRRRKEQDERNAEATAENEAAHAKAVKLFERRDAELAKEAAASEEASAASAEETRTTAARKSAERTASRRR